MTKLLVAIPLIFAATAARGAADEWAAWKPDSDAISKLESTLDIAKLWPPDPPPGFKGMTHSHTILEYHRYYVGTISNGKRMIRAELVYPTVQKGDAPGISIVINTNYFPTISNG